MADPTETPDLMGAENESEKVNPDQERALAGQGGPLPQEFLFDEPGGGETSDTPALSDRSTSADKAEVDGVVDAGMAEDERVHTAKKKPFNKTLATVLMIGSVVGFVIIIFFNFGSRDSQVAEEETTEPEEEIVFEDDSARLRTELALQDQAAVLDEVEQEDEPELVVEDVDDEEIPEPEPSSPPAQPVSSSPPPPRPAPAPQPAPPPRPAPAPQATPAPQVDPFDRWAQLSRLGTERAGEDQIEGSSAAAAPDVFAQAAASGTEGSSSPFQTVSIGEGGSNGGAPEQQRQVQSQPQQVQPQSQPSQSQPEVQPQPESRRSAQASGSSGESALVASTPGTQGILDWQRQRQGRVQQSSPVQPELGTQVQATVVTPMAWDLAAGSDQSPDLGAGRFVIELEQDLTDQRGRVALPRGANLVVQASTVSPDNQLVQASAIAVVYQSRGQSIQQAIPEGALLVQGQGAQPLVAQRLNDLGTQLFTEDLLVGTLSALGRAGEVLNQPQEEFSSAATGDGTSSTVIRTTRDPNLLGGILEGFGDTISGRIQQRSEQNTQAQIDANTVAVLPEGMTVTLVVNSFLEVSP